MVKNNIQSGAFIRIGLPKGRFLNSSLKIIRLLTDDSIVEGKLKYSNQKSGIFIYLLKASDIPKLVLSGLIDIGIAPEEWVLESLADRQTGNNKLVVLKRLPWIKSSLSFIGSGDTEIENDRILSIATSFPNLAQKAFESMKRNQLDFVKINGSIEALVPDLVDIGFDCVETGSTLIANDLINIHIAYSDLQIAIISTQDKSLQVPKEILNALQSDLENEK
ncbi:ATP phosphoribosyltransferase [Leptospira interrogans]|uniref:ATP phosphoribosyltransferase n=1 Tax=Leptospira interrogans TaxID=173 RepID=UPI000774627D|nr:ATP phosphoribosyltransferase [Leptospira interrogans]